MYMIILVLSRNYRRNIKSVRKTNENCLGVVNHFSRINDSFLYSELLGNQIKTNGENKLGFNLQTRPG